MARGSPAPRSSRCSTTDAPLMTTPRATIRLQFHKGFTLDDAAAIVPYLASLGLSHVYASPIFTATPGSMHGYDVIHPNRINPELGGSEALSRLSAALRRNGMGLILDIVPNHMAASAANVWWWDVLKHGCDSRYAEFFDIDWQDPDPALRGKVLLPALGDSLEACLARGELTLDADGAAVSYFDQPFPIEDASEGSLPDLLAKQHYVLTHWREAPQRINWRRFFDINQLVALRMDRDAVFDAYHALILELVRDGTADGVRVDHVDGLADPAAYLRRLRAALDDATAGRDAPYLVVEKILDHDEPLNPDWPVAGTTGYDFMDQVGAILHDPAGRKPLTALWEQLSGDTRPFDDLVAAARREILDRLFPKQRRRLAEILRAEGGDAVSKLDRRSLEQALTALLVALRRYRLYGDAEGFSAADLAVLHAAQAAAKESVSSEDHTAIDAACAALKSPGAQDARSRFQQLSATLTAKAVEDTAFYRYSRLLSRNEVGSNPGRLAISVAEFHALARRRQMGFPDAMLATATHDHKRGEDNRMRLAVLSEMSVEWSDFVIRWCARHEWLEPAVQVTIYQSLIGAWPLDLEADDARGMAALGARLQQWLTKALREAKQKTSWHDPNEAFEKECADFLDALLTPGGAFLTEAAQFVTRIAPAGAVKGLAQTLLRLTMPGVPDLYQGTEFWDFSLVDPDNRRPVDFDARARALADESSFADRLKYWRDGRVKQALIARVLRFRRLHPQLFAVGSYAPLRTSGSMIAFARRFGDDALIVVVPRLSMGTGAAGLALPAHLMQESVENPSELVGHTGTDLLTGKETKLRETIVAAELLDIAPVAALHLYGLSGTTEIELNGDPSTTLVEVTR
jgi:malto-oligosyltrehalose synthase